MKDLGGSRLNIYTELDTYDTLSNVLADLKDTAQIKIANDGKGTSIYLTVQKNSEKISVKRFLKSHLTTHGRKTKAMNHQITYQKVVSILEEKFERDIVLTHIKSAGISKSKVITARLLKNVMNTLEAQPLKPIVENVEPRKIPARRNSLT